MAVIVTYGSYLILSSVFVKVSISSHHVRLPVNRVDVACSLRAKKSRLQPAVEAFSVRSSTSRPQYRQTLAAFWICSAQCGQDLESLAFGGAGSSVEDPIDQAKHRIQAITVHPKRTVHAKIMARDL